MVRLRVRWSDDRVLPARRPAMLPCDFWLIDRQALGLSLILRAESDARRLSVGESDVQSLEAISKMHLTVDGGVARL